MELIRGMLMPRPRVNNRERGFWKDAAGAMGIGDCYKVANVVEAVALRSAMVSLYGKGCAARRRDDVSGGFYVWRLK